MRKKPTLILISILMSLISLSSCGATNHSSQKVGFPDKSLCYGASLKFIKENYNEPKDSFETESGGVNYSIDFENNDVSGQLDFELIDDELYKMVFTSKSGYDIETVEKIAKDMQSFYKNEEGFFVDKSNDDKLPFYIEFGINDDNGATGVYVTVEENYTGEISIVAIDNV